LPDAFDLGVLRLAEHVGDVLERQALVVRLDREHLAEDGLEALRLALLLRDALLQEVQVGVDLYLYEVGRLDDFAELAEVDALGGDAVGHGNYRWVMGRDESKRRPGSCGWRYNHADDFGKGKGQAVRARGLSRTLCMLQGVDRQSAGRGHFSSTLAPAASSFFLISSASALLTPSLTAFGAPSTRSLASLRPRPVMARTSLMTSIFLSPAAARMTLNSVFSSTGAAAAPGAAATATAAAAETPHFSSRSLASSAASSTVSDERSSTIFSRLAIVMRSFGLGSMFRYSEPGSGRVSVGVGPEHARELGCGRGLELRDLGRRGLDEADELCAQFVQRRHGRERLHAIGTEGRRAERSAEDHEFLVLLGEGRRDFRRRHRIVRIG